MPRSPNSKKVMLVFPTAKSPKASPRRPSGRRPPKRNILLPSSSAAQTPAHLQKSSSTKTSGTFSWFGTPATSSMTTLWAASNTRSNISACVWSSFFGHERCGAVTGALAGESAPGHVQSLVRDIQPAVRAVRDKNGDVTHLAVAEHAHLMAAKIRNQASLGELAKEVRIISSVYDLDTGK